MVDGHCEDDGLGEEDAEGAEHAVEELFAEGAVILAGGAVRFVGVLLGGDFFEGLFAGFEDGGGVGFFEEEVAG